MHDPRAVAAIVGALRQVHDDNTARLMLQDGMTLEALIDALLRAPLSDRDSARLMRAALESGDFDIAPDFTTYVCHLKFIYDAPGSFRVRDIVMLTEQRAFSSAEIGLRLRVSEEPEPRPFVTPRAEHTADWQSLVAARCNFVRKELEQ